MASINNSTLLHPHTDVPGTEHTGIVLVRTEWNAGIVDELENGCKKKLAASGWNNIRTITVPGAFEIPFAIKSYWDAVGQTPDAPLAFIALGCVLRGDTPHFDYICKAVTEGVLQLNLMLPVPTVFGVLTVNTSEQAQERIGGIHGHKGEEAAVTALKLIATVKSFTPAGGDSSRKT